MVADIDRSSLDDIQGEARRLAAAGNSFGAYDLAVRALERWPGDFHLRYLSVLTLARLGASDLAWKRFRALGLQGASEAPPPLDIDLPALEARLAKDRALGMTGEERLSGLKDAAERYRILYEKYAAVRPGEAHYPAINAAALSLWSGDGPAARQAAEAALRCLDGIARDRLGYWELATSAEARLILNQPSEAHAAIDAIARFIGGRSTNWQDLASTRRQLERTCRYNGIERSVLDPLHPPPVLVYTGHMVGPRFREENESGVKARVQRELNERRPLAAYGSLAAGSDILIAEELLRLGVEVNVVLPFSLDDFVRESVLPSGESWRARFGRCLDAATSLQFATDDRYSDDASAFHYCSRLVMGRAVVRARTVGGSARMLAVWDGVPPEEGAVAGAATDVAFWSSLGHELSVIHPGDVPPRPSTPLAWQPPPARGDRINAAILFGDIKGFSRLRDSDIGAYVAGVLGTIGEALRKRKNHLLASNTWGDAFFAIMDSVDEAAHCATEIQHRLEELDYRSLGLPGPFSMRIGGHFGPVQRIVDPVRGDRSYMGTQVVKAARIEPVTEPGMIWVTEPFAAALALCPPAPLRCDYLGHVSLAKDFGNQPLFRLREESGDLP